MSKCDRQMHTGIHIPRFQLDGAPVVFRCLDELALRVQRHAESVVRQSVAGIERERSFQTFDRLGATALPEQRISKVVARGGGLWRTRTVCAKCSAVRSR